MATINNKINTDCLVHKKKCDYFCTSTKCESKILCQKCILDHLEVHPRQFIYNMENLLEIHAFDKVSKMKEVLGKQKVVNQYRITQMYLPFDSVLQPLNNRYKQYVKNSKDLMNKELLSYLSQNKAVIENTKVMKSDTNQVKNQPQLMIDETIAEVEIINQKQNEIKENTEKYTWYTEATEQLCQSVIKQLKSMVSVAITLLDNYARIQSSRYSQQEVGRDNHHDQSFFKRYLNSHDVASKTDKNAIEMKLIQSKTQMVRKDQQIKRAKTEIKDKVTKIEELTLKIEGLKEQLVQWQQKLEREQKQKREAVGRQRKKLEQYLIKNDVISNDSKVISLQKKSLQDKFLNLIPQLVPKPKQLILSQHNLARNQLQVFYRFNSLQVFRMSFINCDKQFLRDALKKYVNLHTLELNSANIDDETIEKISAYFPPAIKNLYLIDNKLTDDGLEHMFKNLNNIGHLESLYVSYNNLTLRAIEIINKYCYELKILHISKNPIRSKGAILIGKYLKDIEQLFIGATGIQKEGFLALCRNCFKLRRLSLVANEMTTDIISEILLGLQKLEWLDISYTSLSQSDLEKVEKLRVFNKAVQIIAHV